MNKYCIENAFHSLEKSYNTLLKEHSELKAHLFELIKPYAIKRGKEMPTGSTLEQVAMEIEIDRLNARIQTLEKKIKDIYDN